MIDCISVIVTNPPKPAADGRKWNAVLAWLSAELYCGRPRLSLRLETRFDDTPLGPYRTVHNDHIPFVVDFLEFVFSTVRRCAGGGLKEARHTLRFHGPRFRSTRDFGDHSVSVPFN